MAFSHLRETIKCSIAYRMSFLVGKNIKSTKTESTGERRQKIGLEYDPISKFRIKLNIETHV